MVTLRLIEADDGEVCVIVCNAGGHDIGAGYLIGFTRNGRIRRYTNINDGLGLRLDGSRRVVMER